MASSICICDHCGRAYIKKDKYITKSKLNYCNICYCKMKVLYKEIIQFINMDKPDKDTYKKEGENCIVFLSAQYISMSLGIEIKAINEAINEFFDNDGPDSYALKNLINKTYEKDNMLELLDPSEII